MKLLFTKKIDEKQVSKKIGGRISYDFVEVLKFHHIEVKPFDLKNNSLIFTSINGVRSFFKNGFKPNENFKEENFNKVYAVGLKTKNELRRHGFGTFKVARHASELADFIVKNCHNEKLLHFCGNLALDVLDKDEVLQGINYRKIPVYETKLLYPTLSENYDAVAFFSPSGVRSYLKNNSIEGKKIFSIGYTTERELKKYTQQPIYTSKESNLDDLLSIIVKQSEDFQP